jgi:uncharacterized protein YgbK (DUF1537 family)
MTADSWPFGIAATLQDALALAEAFGPGAQIGFLDAGGAILAPKAAWLSPADAVRAFRPGRTKYHFAFEAIAPDETAPVVEALVQAAGTGFMPVCLAAPWAGRTVYQGHLFEGGRLASSLARDFGVALGGSVGIVAHDIVAAGALAIRRQCAALKEQGRALAFIDCINEDDCAAIAEAFGSFALTGGGAWAVARPHAAEPDAPAGNLAILSGALARQTVFQIGAARGAVPVFDLDFTAADPAADALAWAAGQDKNFIITSTVPPDRLTAGAKAEAVFGQIAQGLAAAGTKRLILAGTATARAVLSALGIEQVVAGAAFEGLRWLQAPGLAICVKHGAAGPRNLFLSEFGPQIRLNAPAE